MKLNFFLFRRVQKILCAASLGLTVLTISAGAFPAPQWMQGGHAARITGVACSPDGTMIASSSEDGTLKLWSTNGTLLRTLTTQPGPITALAWSPDGLKIAAGTYYGGYYKSAPGMGLTCLWQAPSGSQSAWTGTGVNFVRASTNLFGKVTAVAFSTDSTMLASGCAAGSNYVTSVADGSLLSATPAYNIYDYYGTVEPAMVTSLSFSSSGMMASACEDSTWFVYEYYLSGTNYYWYELTMSYYNYGVQTTNVTALAFSTDGALLATASMDQTIKIWASQDNYYSPRYTCTGHVSGVTSVAFNHNASKMVSGSMDGTAKVWNSRGNCLLTIPAHSLPVTATVFTPNSGFVVTGSDDGTVRLWSAFDGSAVAVLGGQTHFIGATAISPDGALCATAGGDQTIEVRKTSDGSLVQTLVANTNYVSSLAFSPDSVRLASGGGPLDPTIKIWQISSGTLLNKISATTNGVMALAWSPDGLTLAAGGDSVERNITFWSTNGNQLGTLSGTLSGHTNGITSLTFSPQGNLLASGGRRPGNTVRIWTNSVPGIWTSGSIIQTFASSATNNNVECVAFSPDGTKVAFGSTAVGVLKVGLISNGSSVTLGSGTYPVFSVAFSPDGNALAAAIQNTIQIWTNGASWALFDTVTNEAVRASSLAYSPNGNLLLCGREDGTLTMLPNTRGAKGQPKLTFGPLKFGAGGATTINASVLPGVRYTLLSSTDMINWSFLTSAMSTSNSLTIPGLSASGVSARFYRATTPP